MWRITIMLVLACSKPIATSIPIARGDAQLVMELRGPVRTAPILLYLHGGPGSALGVVAFRAYVGPALESRYVVAYLHQRGVLDSPAVLDAKQTIANHVADVEAAVHDLRARFPDRKLFLVGHSWGGTLALLSILDKPDLVDGVVDIAGPFDFEASKAASYAATLAWARTAHVADAIAQLEANGPPPYHEFDKQLVLSMWSSAANDGLAAHLSEARLLSRAPYTKLDPAWQTTELRVATAMYADLGSIALTPRLAELHTPLLVIVGALDTVVPGEQLRVGFAAYGGPKTWVALDHAHHLAFVDEPERLVDAIAAFVGR